MNFTGKIRLKGWFRLRVLRAMDGKVLRVISIPNQVCVGALDAFQRLATQIIPGDDDVNECLLYGIWAGTDATAPTAADLSLGCIPADQFRKAFDPGTLAIDVGGTMGLMQMQMTMQAAEGNGRTYVEAGLFTQGPPAVAIDLQNPGTGPGNARMVCRQLHASVEKNAGVVLEYTWRLQLLTV